MTASIRLKPLLLSIAIPLAGGFISNWLSGDIRGTYETLNLPPFAPDGKWFGIVWPILYVLMGIAAYLIWKQPDSSARTQALTFYGVQLAMNLLWSPLFFRFGLYMPAFWLLCAMLVMVLVTTGCFWLLDKRTLWLMLPYILWLVFALILNRAIAGMN